MIDRRVYRERLPELRRRSERYRSEFLDRELGLSNIALITESPRGRVLSADSASGRIILKFFLGRRVPVARLAACVQHAYGKRGIDVPEIVFSDLTQSVEVEYGIGCIATRFIDGTALRRGDARQESRAFQNLAEIHRVVPVEVTSLELPGISIDADGRPLRLGRLRNFERQYRCDVAEIREFLQGPLRGLRAADVQRVENWRDEAEARMQEFGLARVVLHGDYHSNNLVFASDSAPYAIDFENACVGPFRAELGAALLRMLYGANSWKLDRFDLDRLLDEPRLRTAEEAYFSVAPERSRDFWAKHREAALLSAYLWTVWRCSHRAQRAYRYSFARRMRYRVQAFERWKRFLHHLNRGS
ncbi:MAG: aminoglycoside phosphotransferase family protein [Deltaproteobacteria bacterium]|nr:aminoglycoside phosphotransferase family protein [Deltaproteobacteria bacterium]